MIVGKNITFIKALGVVFSHLTTSYVHLIAFISDFLLYRYACGVLTWDRT